MSISINDKEVGHKEPYVLPTMRLMEHSNITYISFPAYKLEPDDGQLTFCCDQWKGIVATCEPE